ncbi:MAG TPA: hypothetical protein K8V56_14975 [Sporosarcina psychrophila]|uniref:Uncharacterized protein n=1 Tax=Sporosarcina psychrophila TaxID=1476 RepID=A0A921G093_SPOPS|nr:hypothetical protein [Sporosarcina psychrophila]
MHTGHNGYPAPHYQTYPKIDRLLANWSEQPKGTVYSLISKYGLPNEASTERMIWINNGPWKRTVVHRDTVLHNFPTTHLDYLAQTIDYKVPIEFFDDLAKFDGSLYPDRTAGEITAKCDQEGANFMAINLMNDIVTRRFTVEQARTYAIDIEKRLRLQGQSSLYLEKLFFPKQTHTADPDVRYF